MQKELKAKFTLTISGSKIKVFHAFANIKLPGMSERLREEFIDNAYVPDDDEPLDVESRVSISNMADLTRILQAFTGQQIRTALWVEAGSEKADGFRVGLEDSEKYMGCWWYCDTGALIAKSKETIAAAVDGLQKLI